jgi:hypothetical protein
MMLKYILFACFLLTLSGLAHAQDPDVMTRDLSKIKIEELSDAQIRQIRQQERKVDYQNLK